MHDGEGGVEQDEGHGVIDGQPELIQRGDDPHQHEEQPQRDSPEEQENAAAPPAGADAVGDQAEERIVDRVPQAAGADSPTGVIGTQPGDIGQEVELEEHQDRQRDAGAQVAGAEEQFGAQRQRREVSGAHRVGEILFFFGLVEIEIFQIAGGDHLAEGVQFALDGWVQFAGLVLCQNIQGASRGHGQWRVYCLPFPRLRKVHARTWSG